LSLRIVPMRQRSSEKEKHASFSFCASRTCRCMVEFRRVRRVGQFAFCCGWAVFWFLSRALTIGGAPRRSPRGDVVGKAGLLGRWPRPPGPRRQCLRRSTRTDVRVSRAHCYRDVATDRRASSTEIWKTDRSRASGPPMPGEGRSPNGPADREYAIEMQKPRGAPPAH
jgi:hypothetical protein